MRASVRACVRVLRASRSVQQRCVVLGRRTLLLRRVVVRAPSWARDSRRFGARSGRIPAHRDNVCRHAGPCYDSSRFHHGESHTAVSLSLLAYVVWNTGAAADVVGAVTAEPGVAWLDTCDLHWLPS